VSAVVPSIREPIVDPLSLAESRAHASGALFLDRDGVINHDSGYVHTQERTHWIPGVFELVALARFAGLPTVVVTNQAGIARAYYDESAFRDYTEWQHDQFRRRGSPILATYYCPHHPDAGSDEYRMACACRKPAPGMILKALADFRFDKTMSLLIGDKPWDIEAAEAAGVGGAYLAADGNLAGAAEWLRSALETGRVSWRDAKPL
jgi:D-glycero-D-manno-heptose 1,7-bisphosphate phosphatase